MIQAVIAGGFAVFIGAFLAAMWKIYSGMKQFLTDNIEEALIVSGECVAEQVLTVSRRIDVLQGDVQNLRGEITRQLEAISAVIMDANDKAEIGVNGIVKELNYIIPSMRDEMEKMLQALSNNDGKFQADTIKTI